MNGNRFIPLLLISLLAKSAFAEAPKEDRRPTVAVLYFDYTGKDEQMGMLRKGLAQMLISDLGALDGIRIVERDRLQALLDELKLGQSDKIDPKTANQVGKLLGARFLVVGGYFDLMGTLRVDARLLEVETGRVLHSVGASGKPGDFLTVEQKLSDDLAKSLASQAAAQLSKESAAPAKRPRPKPPGQLQLFTAVRYAKALDALDHGNKAVAKTELQNVVKEQPDFKLAALDLDRLMQ